MEAAAPPHSDEHRPVPDPDNHSVSGPLPELHQSRVASPVIQSTPLSPSRQATRHEPHPPPPPSTPPPRPLPPEVPSGDEHPAPATPWASPRGASETEDAGPPQDPAPSPPTNVEPLNDEADAAGGARFLKAGEVEARLSGDDEPDERTAEVACQTLGLQMMGDGDKPGGAGSSSAASTPETRHAACQHETSTRAAGSQVGVQTAEASCQAALAGPKQPRCGGLVG